MPMRWHGAEVGAAIIEATKKAVDKTMAECVIEAKSNHPYENVTGTAEGSVRIVDFAEVDGDHIVGRWGSVDVVYFIFLELGTIHMSPFPSLRPAADKMYPNLKQRLREAGLRVV